MITKKPLVSIVISYYSKKKYINRTLNSILNQTYKNYELIFVYDDLNDIKFKPNKLILKKIHFDFEKIVIACGAWSNDFLKKK